MNLLGSGDISDPRRLLNPCSLPFSSLMRASCSLLLIGLFFFGLVGLAGFGGGLVACLWYLLAEAPGRFFLMNSRSWLRTSLVSSSMSNSTSSSLASYKDIRHVETANSTTLGLTPSFGMFLLMIIRASFILSSESALIFSDIHRFSSYVTWCGGRLCLLVFDKDVFLSFFAAVD